MKTISAKPCDIKRNWYIVDAQSDYVGRIATNIATVLKGKHKAIFTPHVDCGDYVIITNAEKSKFSGKKETDKKYWWHTEFPGGIKSISVEKQREKHPDRIITSAVKGMLPKGPLGRKMLKKLKIYNGSEHPHEANQVKPLSEVIKLRG